MIHTTYCETRSGGECDCSTSVNTGQLERLIASAESALPWVDFAKEQVDLDAALKPFREEK